MNPAIIRIRGDQIRRNHERRSQLWRQIASQPWRRSRNRQRRDEIIRLLEWDNGLLLDAVAEIVTGKPPCHEDGQP